MEGQGRLWLRQRSVRGTCYREIDLILFRVCVCVSLSASGSSAATYGQKKRLSAFKADPRRLWISFYPFRDAFPWKTLSSGCSRALTRGGEDGVVRRPDKSPPPAVARFLLDQLMCSNGGLGACTKS